MNEFIVLTSDLFFFDQFDITNQQPVVYRTEQAV